ncbi:DNAJ domain-containing protein [Terrimicrobium sacchariphilum]|uniref:DNAJ domain-containing protein n=1 Tax=Terrimicrobium sacchariphilum TaxID=690879 RepID=A0A146G4Y5_TERSA|nr:J domain-containing protein [Terrimicrobium sacchariphilum]GAT32859.1 DNAJ domain-containing protein [Terrimicrobium sacchariphilum]
MRREFLGVTDAFSLFGIAARPIPDETDLKERYLRESAAAHPDSGRGDAGRFTELQEAYRVLSDPAARLRLLAGDGDTVGRLGSPEIFMLVGGTMQAANAALQTRSSSTTALSRAVSTAECRAAAAKVTLALEAIADSRARLDARLRELDTRWPAVEPGELAALAGDYAFTGKWEAQLREAEFKLAHG